MVGSLYLSVITVAVSEWKQRPQLIPSVIDEPVPVTLARSKGIKQLRHLCAAINL